MTWSIRYLLGNAADGAMQVGDWDWAVQALTEQLQVLEEPAERIWYGGFLTAIRAYRGEEVDDDARRLYDEGRAFDDPQYRVVGALPLATGHLVNGDLRELIRISDEALAVGLVGADAAQFGARAATWLDDAVTANRMRKAYEGERAGRRTDATLATIDAGIAMREGRSADARVGYADAQGRWRELQLPFWLAMCDLDIVITGAMQPDERRRATAEAREIFERLRAQGLIDRLDAALAASAEGQPPSDPATRATAEVEVAQEA